MLRHMPFASLCLCAFLLLIPGGSDAASAPTGDDSRAVTVRLFQVPFRMALWTLFSQAGISYRFEANAEAMLRDRFPEPLSCFEKLMVTLPLAGMTTLSVNPKS